MIYIYTIYDTYSFLYIYYNHSTVPSLMCAHDFISSRQFVYILVGPIMAEQLGKPVCCAQCVRRVVSVRCWRNGGGKAPRPSVVIVLWLRCETLVHGSCFCSVVAAVLVRGASSASRFGNSVTQCASVGEWSVSGSPSDLTMDRHHHFFSSLPHHINPDNSRPSLICMPHNDASQSNDLHVIVTHFKPIAHYTNSSIVHRITTYLSLIFQHTY